MKRWLGLFAVLAITTVVAVSVVRQQQEPHRKQMQFEKIQVGMTDEEVIKLMGPPSDRGRLNMVWDRTWYVEFDIDNRVTEKYIPKCQVIR